MPISTSKDEEKSRANEASSSSLAKAEKIIFGKPESRSNIVPSRTKVFSSFQVGKQHTKEEEYLTLTRYIYNLPEESGETFGVLGTTSLFPRISIFPNGLSSFTAQLLFSISLEGKDLQAYYPTLNYISVEKIKDFNVKATGDHDWVLFNKGKSKSKELKERILDIELHRLGATKETWKLACKMLDHDHP
ncbi:hypothetical protein H5410_013315 [Solanum commersonii]|uniref:Uncharacterized protein n=1 Tax=Solanum commersonii TaxID=4109 RepID=A0A9J6AUS4_SOLCO|nr:hypothetical protein H5410_013315 [Solanum commersonii]